MPGRRLRAVPRGVRSRFHRRDSRGGLHPADDRGLSLLEVVVAIAVVGVVMTAVTSFFVRSVGQTNQQRGKQIATHLADSAMERVRALKGSSVADGRKALDTATEYRGDPVVPLPDSGTRWRNELEVGATPLLPTTVEIVTVAGTPYERYWYVGECWMTTSVLANITGSVDCVKTKPVGGVPMFRVVVAIVWSDKACNAGRCTFVSSTLVSAEAEEPIFNENETADWPTIQSQGDLVDFLGTAITARTFTTKNGVPPVRISGENLPPGVTLSPNGEVFGTPTRAGTYLVLLKVTDYRDRFGTAAFVWTIKTVTTLTNPGTQLTAVGVPVSLQIADTGPGEAPITWQLTGTPPSGITFNNGVFSGTPVVSGQSPALTVRATDANRKFSEVRFTWTTVPDWYVTPVAAKSSALNSDVSTEPAVTAVAGVTPYTWQAVNLPAGVTINSVTGRFAGRPTARGTRTVTVTATDGRLLFPQSRTAQFTWTVT